MKKIYLFLSAVLLLSATASAQVAKVGSTGYATIDEAIAVWTTDGGTLQLLDNCDYTATATATIAKASTLDLNGKTLTWKIDNSKISAITISGGTLTIKDDTKAGKLSFLLTNMSGVPTNGIVYADSKGTAESFTIENATLAFDVQAASTCTSGLATKVIHIKKGNVSISNSTLLTKNNAAYALYLDCASASVRLEKFDNNTIRYEGCTADKLLASQVEGVHIVKIDADNDVVFNNCTIDMSLAPVQYDKYSSKRWSKGNTTIYGLNVVGGSNNKSNVTIVGGEYKTPTNSTYTSVRAVTQSTYMTIKINSGKFEGKNSVKTAVGGIEGGSFIPCPSSQYAKSGYHFTKQSDGYYALEAGEPLFTINEEGFTDVNELKKYTDGKATVTVFTTNTFTIPAEANIRLSVKDVNTAYTIVNNGTVLVNNEFSGKFTNNGTLNISEACPNGEFTNNGTAAVYSDGTCKSLTNSGTLNIGGNPHSAGDFTASTLVNTGTLTVSAGTYTAQQYNSLIKDNIATGYRGWALDATKQKYKVASLTASSFEVDGVGYSKIADALKVCTEATPVIFCKDCSSGCTISDGKDYYVNLNGKKWSIPTVSTKNAHLIISHGGLTISGTGKIVSPSHGAIALTGHATEPNYTRLTIGEGITLTNETYSSKYILTLQNAPCGGIVVNFNGNMVANANKQGWCHGFYVNGTLTSTTNAPVFNIGEKAEITIEKGIGAYAAGYAKWNFAGKMVADTCGFELRAGEFTMNGGSIEATMTAPADDQFNGNGSTSQACGIAVCQHSTQLPITVTINGGDIKAYTPIYQANPQENKEEVVKKTVSVVVNNTENGVGPRIYSTSKNIVWSANRVVTLNGGVYNMNPSAYVADNKVVVANDDETYCWKIVTKETTAATFATAGNWNEAGNWSNSTMATAATSATINANVVIGAGVRAEAYGIKVNSDKTITIKDGGMLVVGKDGISGIADTTQLKIEDGGYLFISPAATTNNQPLASVVKTLNTYKKAAGTFVAGVEDEYVRCYMGSVMTSKPVAKKAYTWSGKYWDYASGWQDATPTTVPILSAPFRGFALTTDGTSAPSTPVTMKGTLVGNEKASLSMAGKGFHFFANSWMAPLDAYEVLNQLDKLRNEGKVESSLKILLPLDVTIGDDDWSAGTFVDINRSFLRLGNNSEYWGTIAPMAGFFLRANEPVTVGLEYEQAVWNVMLAPKSSAPRRVMSAVEDNITGVRIKLMASDGHKDRLYIWNGEPIESSTKMMNDVPNVNIYVDNAGAMYSTYAAETLLGTEIGIQCNASTAYTLSFDYAEGEVLYLKDLATGIVTEMSDGATYTFTADPNTTATRFRIVSRSEVTTGVDDLTTTDTETAIRTKGIYSVTGQYLGTADQLPTLPAGVYIINGKKVVK